MRFKKLFNITFSLFFSFTLMAQNGESIKTLLASKLHLADSLKYSNADYAVELADEVIKIAKENDLKPEHASANKLLANIYAEKGNYLAALQSINSSITIYQELNDTEQLCISYIYSGIIHRYLKLYEESIEAYLKAERLADQLDKKNLSSSIYGNLGNVFYDISENEKALEYHKKSLEINKELNNEEGMANSYHNIGLVLKDLGRLEEAMDYHQKSIEIDTKVNNLRNIAISYLDFIDLHIAMWKMATAKEYAIKSLQVTREISSKRLEKQVLGKLSILEAAQGNTEKAFELHNEFTAITDSLNTANLREQIANLEATFNSEQKDRELNIQNLELEAQQLSLSRQRYLILGLVLIILLFGIVAWLLFNRYKLKQNLQQITLKNERFRLSQNLQIRKDIDETINYFASSLYGKNTVKEILWDITKNCISRLGLVDCVIYLLDEERQILIQSAAYGIKNQKEYEIHNPLEIPIGEGIVGSVAKSGKPEIVNDTLKDKRYIVDDLTRFSELAVPILHHKKVIGVIDSEHPEKDFFTQYHLDSLKTIAAICSSKIAQAKANEISLIAEKAQREAENIKQLDQIKSRFFANISHEFRTPLNLILAPLQDNHYVPSSSEIGMIRRNAFRLLRLVNQLLDLAKMEVGLMKLNLIDLEIYSFMSDIAEAFYAVAASKSIEFQVDIPDRNYIVHTDPDKLEKIIYNLLSNAMKFTNEGGKVTIHSSLESDQILRIVVSDTGIGIPEHLKYKIFDRFYQVEGVQYRVIEGTGIGLSLTKELIDMLEGTIDLDSQEQKGCTFTVKIPVELRESPSNDLFNLNLRGQINGIGQYEYLGSRKINLDIEKQNQEKEILPLLLLVEDNDDLRNYVAAKLRESYSLLVAENGKQALVLAKEKIPDMIVSDIMMPEMDGITLTKMLREDRLTSHIPIVLLTAKDDVSTKIEGFTYGAEQFLVKPFDMDELFARLNSLFKQRTLLNEKFSKELRLEPTKLQIANKDAELLKKLIVIIESNITNEDFSVEKLQKEIGMSRMQLHRKLKALTNKSTNDFIRSIKLKRAAQLLKQPGIQVSEAAFLSGFSHLSYFTKCFKEQFGVLPSAFAEQ